MRIEQNFQTTTAASVSKTAPPPAPKVDATLPPFADSQRLNQALAETPAVRAEQVARAKALLTNPNYPSPQQLEHIAQLLATHLSRDEATA